MPTGRASAYVLAGLAGVVLAATSAATPGREAKPRIVAAAMLDSDRDARADGVRLTYSVRVRHALDRDGRYPFAVAGYAIRSVSISSGRSLLIRLVERAKPDPSARPAIRYRRTRAKPVTARSGAQAAAQLFRATRPHQRRAAPLTVTATATTTPTPTTTPTTTPTALDADGDGHVDAKDCAPRDASIHPGAADVPDLAFVDSNCDEIDGTEQDAIFVSPNGNDANPGTKARPKRQIQAAAATVAAGNGRYVLAAAGAYDRVVAVSGMHVYGGYDPGSWSRGSNRVSSIVGVPEGIEADGARDVTLQLLSVRGLGAGPGDSAYGIRAIRSSSLLLQRVAVTAANGLPGALGANAAAGRPGSPGLKGANGACDHDVKAPGGAGGDSIVGRVGGKGGDGHYESDGGDGMTGLFGTQGGKGGKADERGVFIRIHGEAGRIGSTGSAGTSGAGGTNSVTFASTTWRGRGGVPGIYGAPGNGGGGGGAGGGQVGAFVVNGTGNGGGGGGGGGEGGRGGEGGLPGGGSFGIYLVGSSLVAEQSSVAAGDGGTGGRGGNGGPGGSGGAGGSGNTYCRSEIGIGAAGGRGGDGGQGGGGGGGAGGPTIGIFKLGAQTRVTLSGTRVSAGTPGAGGAPGAGGTPAAAAEAGIAAAIYPS